MIKRIINNTFLKSVLTLSGGTIIGQIITFIAAPIMTRLYTPEEIGIYTLIITAVSMFGSIIAGRYDMSIVTEENNKNVFALVKLSLLISLISSILISLVYTLFYYTTATVEISFIFFFMSICFLLFLTGMRLITVAFNNREEHYRLISKSSVYEAVNKEFSLIGMGLLAPSYVSLVFSHIIGRITNISIQIKKSNVNIANIRDIKWKNVKLVAQKYKNQPIYSVPALFGEL